MLRSFWRRWRCCPNNSRLLAARGFGGQGILVNLFWFEVVCYFVFQLQEWLRRSKRFQLYVDLFFCKKNEGLGNHSHLITNGRKDLEEEAEEDITRQDGEDPRKLKFLQWWDGRQQFPNSEPHQNPFQEILQRPCQTKRKIPDLLQHLSKNLVKSNGDGSQILWPFESPSLSLKGP